METKICLQCGSEIKGRVDKKFCDDQCRTAFNNHVNCDTIFMRTIHHNLRKNRKILKELIPPEMKEMIISRRKLEEKGFCFTYHTHTQTNKAGTVYRFCYEYGITPADHDHFIIINQESE